MSLPLFQKNKDLLNIGSTSEELFSNFKLEKFTDK